MEWLIAAIGHWKELGAVGIFLLACIKAGGRVLDWSLSQLGINIGRKQSREDLLAQGLEALRKEFSDMGKRLTKVEAAYEVTADICHKCADGIEAELNKQSIHSPTILFFVFQLRQVQRIEDVLKD